jgi:hypothetical protein
MARCENAGQEYAYRRQHKFDDQGERRHIWRVSLPAGMVVSVGNTFEFFDCRTNGASLPRR